MSKSTNPPVVTLFESFGAGADEIGPRVAEALGVPWLQQQVTTGELERADPKGRAGSASTSSSSATR